MIAVASFAFYHGLGDCSNCAHMIPLYTRRGLNVEVECTADKACVFEAAGAHIVRKARSAHEWPHPPVPGRPLHDAPWEGSKTAWNISRGPLPDIGCVDCLWQELMAVRLELNVLVPSGTRKAVERKLEKWPGSGPLVVVHTAGNSGKHLKNFTDEETLRLYRALLDLTDARLLLLDWDSRVYRLNSGRVWHLTDDLHKLDLPGLHVLLQNADLLIGVDSGPLHFARFARTPAIGVWTRHHPSHFALPRAEAIHIVPATQREVTKYRRVDYNIIESPGERPNPEFIAEQAARMLGKPRYLAGQPARDTVLRHFVSLTRGPAGQLSEFVDRHKSFGTVLDRLGRLPHLPVIVETGCIRAEEDWSGAGFSTYLFGFFVAACNGTLHSIDLSPKNVAFAREWTAVFGAAVKVYEQSSHEWLMSYSGTAIDLFYSDSADVDTEGFQECCLREVQLALPKMRQKTGLILIDDTCWSKGQFYGKGVQAVAWLLGKGWKILYSGYQTLLEQ